MSTRIIRVIGSKPAEYDRTMKVNADFNWTVQAKEDDKVTPKNTTGWTMTMVIKAENGDVYATYTIGSGITHTPASGLFVIHITKAQVGAYKFRKARYELSINDGTNQTVPLVGNVEVLP